MKQFHRKSVQLAIIVVVTLLAYSNIFSNEFLIDDRAFITNWEKVRSLSSIPDLLKGSVPPVHEGVYRPIRSVLYAVYYSLFGTNPFGWHLHSLVVHLASTILIYLIVDQIVKVVRIRNQELGIRAKNHNSLFIIHNSIPFVSAFLFGLHPIHTESITYIAASMEMTGVVFFFASFYFYLRGRNKELGIRNYGLSLLFALLAFFTYEMTLTLPLLIVLYKFTLDRIRNQKSHNSLFIIPNSIPYFVLAALYVFIRQVIIAVPASRGEYLAYSFYHTQLTMLKVYVKYIWLLIAPYNVSYLHELVPGFFSWMTKYDKLESILAQSLFDPEILFSIMVITVIIVIIIIARKRAPLVTFSIAWFFISLLPVSYIVPQGIALAEKYLYIASFGYVLLLGLFIGKIPNHKLQIPNKSQITNSKRFGAWCLVFICYLVLGAWYFMLTYQRNRDWHDPISFWGKAAKQQPKSPLAHYNLALSYGAKNDIEKAAFHYQQAIAIEPRFWEARFNLANIYLRTGQIDLAAKEYKTVLLLNPEFPAAQENLRLIEKEIRQRNV